MARVRGCPGTASEAPQIKKNLEEAGAKILYWNQKVRRSRGGYTDADHRAYETRMLFALRPGMGERVLDSTWLLDAAEKAIQTTTK